MTKFLLLLIAISVGFYYAIRLLATPLPGSKNKNKTKTKVGEIKLVPFYDLESQSLTMIPERELDDGAIKVRIDHLGIDAFVDADQYNDLSA